MPIQTIDDIRAFEQTPLAERNLPPSTYAMLQRGAARNPEKPALHFLAAGEAYSMPITWTFQQLVESITQTANMLHDLGIQPGQVVSKVLPSLPQSYFTVFGGEAAGIVNPINPLLEADTIADIMNAAGAKVLVTLAPMPGVTIWEKATSIVEKVPTLETVLAVDMSHTLPFLTKADLPERIAQASVLDFDSTRQQYPGDYLISGREIQPDDIASYFHTGGTTGTPKIAQHTHMNEVFDSWVSGEVLGLEEDKTLFCGLPLFHVNGVIVTGLVPWGVGATVVLGTAQGYREPTLIPNFWKIVEHYKINFFSGVPTVYSMLLNVPIGEADIRSLEFAICGAAPMPVEVFQSFEQRTGLRILEGYGLTEGTCVSSVNPIHGERRVGSVGFRLPYQEMTVVKYEDGAWHECADDEIGTLVIRGANVFKGYKEERHNSGLWIDLGDGAPWMNTGDMGRRDADGYFWLTGRQKELIIRGGHNIDPKLIEEPLHKHPAVALAAAVPRPDAHAGEIPVVYVQLEPGASVTEEELLQFAQEHIGERAAIPKHIQIVDSIPQTAVGKIFKPIMARWQIEQVYAQAVRALEGVEAVEVSATADRLHGTLAHIQVTTTDEADPADVEQRIHDALGQYTVRYEIVMV